MSEWRDDAACRDEDPELFFPIGHGPAAQAQIAAAKAVCARCPVVRECLAWALENGQDAGVWGGLTEEERRALRREGLRALDDDNLEGGPKHAAKAGSGRAGD
ncbi:MAG TPA: WhiB family transcriptional regulator [Acidothermaceae bacterium]